MARDSLGMICFTFLSLEKSKEVHAKLTSNKSNDMDAIEGAEDATRYRLGEIWYSLKDEYQSYEMGFFRPENQW